MPQSIHTRNLK